MFKKYLTLVLILTLFQIPLGFASPPAAEIANNNPVIHIDSSLSLESFTSVSNLDSSEPETAVLLEFENELTSEQIEFAELNNLVFSKRASSIIHVGSIYAATITDTTSITDLSDIGLIQMTPSKQFIPSLTSSVESIGAPDVWSNLQRDGVSITGIGITVAVIDTGASWIHPTFWRASTGAITVLQDGSDFYADINGDNVIDPNEGPIAVVDGQTGSEITYGSTYMFVDTDDNGIFDYAHGDQWLGPVDANDDGKCTLTSENVVVLGESKIAKLYDQATGLVYVRGVNMTEAASVGDMNGHGTHVASTIAGGQPGMTSYVGVAPGADLIIIKSPLDSITILDAIQFAIENDADIINMSFSSYLGFLDGTDTEDLAISEAFIEHGVMSTLAAGNLGGRSKHARFEVSSGSTAGATVSVSNPPSYSFLNVLWNSADDNEQIFLTAPGSSEPIDLGVFSEIDDSSYVLETETLSVYVFAKTSVRGMNRLIIQISEDDHFWDAGIWTISLNNPSGSPVWVDAYAWDNSWSGSSLRFSSMVDSSRTISTPGTADLGITVASYNEVSGDTSASSSQGPRVDGARKPDVIAPGDGINAARSSLTTLWATRSGTSMAAPHVAGVLALIRQASNTDNGWTDLSSLFAGAGKNDDHYSPPSNEWGYGLVDPAWSSQHLLQPELDEIFWNGISALITDPVDASINSSLDINEIKVHQTLETISIAVSMNGIVDFTGNDVFTVYWDVDSSMATGFQGGDFLLNITNDQATLFEWSGSVFQTSSSTVEWFNESQTVVIRLQRADSDSFGRISVMTSNETTSPVDDTALIQISDQWRPIVTSLSMTVDGTNFGINIEIADIDSPNSVLEIGMSVIDGAQNTLDSDMVTGVNSNLFQIDTSDFLTDDIPNVVLNISDGVETIYLPFIALTTGLSTNIEFVNATIDQEVIYIGPLLSERITGQIVLSGHLFVSDVRLSFISSIGLKLNLTLNGYEGIYDFDVSPSGFSLGDYEVYAIAFDQSGTPLELHFATLSIVQDYTIVIMMGGIAAVGIIIIVIIRNRSQTLEVV